MMTDPLLSLTEAFQLMGLLQCLLLLAYLAGCGGDRGRRFLAASFFLILAASFGLPLWPGDGPAWVPGLLAAIGAGLPALSYLLAVQMLEGRLPKAKQFLVLLVPLAGGPLLVAGQADPEASMCAGSLCGEASWIAQLWQVFSGGGLLLAIMALVELRLRTGLPLSQTRERRGLALGLVIINLAGLAAILADLSGILMPEEAKFAVITLGLGFIYLATTMMFRIFPESLEFSLHSRTAEAVLQPPPAEAAAPAKTDSKPLDEADRELLDRIQRYLEKESPHLKEDFHRQDMAMALGVPEHRLSKVVNQGFGRSLIDLLNEMRVEEAKLLLLSTDKQVTQVAFESGFNALPSFHRVFRKHAGCAPSEWREKNRDKAGKSTLKS